MLIDYLRGFAPATAYLAKCQKMERWINAVTVMELYAAPAISPEQQEKMSRLFEDLTGVADVSGVTARRTGELLAKNWWYTEESNGIRTAAIEVMPTRRCYRQGNACRCRIY